jgi:hypothetical protein
MTATVEVVVRCGFCRAVVTREVDPGGEDAPAYCNPTHRKAAYRRRRKRRLARHDRYVQQYLDKALSPGPLCPKPYKQVFATRELAQAFIDITFPTDRALEPYPCPCGAIHIGHSSKGHTP